jgi:hypothetical protein
VSELLLSFQGFSNYLVKQSSQTNGKVQEYLPSCLAPNTRGLAAKTKYLLELVIHDLLLIGTLLGILADNK